MLFSGPNSLEPKSSMCTIYLPGLTVIYRVPYLFLIFLKNRELGMSQSDIPWSVTPVKNTTTSDVQVLIQQEFLEDSSDEEYNPDGDQDHQHSDDEKDVENSMGSDFDSQPSTPATPGDPTANLEMPSTPEVQYDEEGVFKVPLT